MNNEDIKAALECLARFCGFDSIDKVTSIEADRLHVKVTVLSTGANGRPLTNGNEFVTQTIERRWQ